jgi:hypothetical protein
MTVIELRQHRPRGPLGEDGRARMEELLRAKQLSGYDRGALVALGRQGSSHDRERIQAKLGHGQAQGPPVTRRQASTLIRQQVRDAIDRAFAERDAEGDL